MLKEFLSASPLAIWPLLAFVLFFAVFVAVVAVLAWGKMKKRNFDHVAGLPLDRDSNDLHAGTTHE